MVEPVLQPDGLQEAGGAFLSLRSADKVAFEHRNLHVFQRRKGGEEVERLEDEPDLVRTIRGWVTHVGD